jgi:hypothetical protein
MSWLRAVKYGVGLFAFQFILGLVIQNTLGVNFVLPAVVFAMPFLIGPLAYFFLHNEPSAAIEGMRLGATWSSVGFLTQYFFVAIPLGVAFGYFARWEVWAILAQLLFVPALFGFAVQRFRVYGGGSFVKGMLPAAADSSRAGKRRRR